MQVPGTSRLMPLTPRTHPTCTGWHRAWSHAMRTHSITIITSTPPPRRPASPPAHALLLPSMPLTHPPMVQNELSLGLPTGQTEARSTGEQPSTFTTAGRFTTANLETYIEGMVYNDTLRGLPTRRPRTISARKDLITLRLT